jgi:hypothetical protein
MRMRESDIWKHASESEFDNAVEGMEKLVMNRLYDLSVFLQCPPAKRMLKGPFLQYLPAASGKSRSTKARNFRRPRA